MKNRQDAWSEENDLLLAETVLRHVREGSTQLNAFEEVGDQLNRTSAACGFRWNAVVRHQYEKALALAKKQRKQRNRLLGKEQGGKKKLLYQPPVPSIEEVEAMSLPLPNDIEIETEQLPYVSPVNNEELSMEKVIAFLQTLSSTTYQSDRLKQENARLKHEVEQLTKEKAALEETVRELEQNTVTMQEDYETLIKIMNRARKLVLFDEEEPSPTAFKMDRNGNLEKLAE
ncbi:MULTISPECIES: RsfA family transcriptional regulator [Bacillaceae]|uniref:RsfA family transcriptional regulator n=1 Tax=Bacillaceae TaxID=186817 RepID=UPI000E7540F1|nr:RsfA family transcriptional regulator [Bacillus sp. PK3_68]RJS60769.1 RsfA family transcriptional regulator [Bacillus sp. PK3_68]